MAKGGRGRSQTWKTFLHNHTAGIGAMDFLIVPTVGFRLLFVLVILRHERRRLISLSVTDHPTADWIARQLTDAFPWDEAPDYMIRDRDGCYGQAVTKRLAAMGIRDHPIALRSPWQNGHAERLIGSIRRECLDHIVVFGEAHLRRILASYAAYYNEVRTHLALDKDSPGRRPIQRLGQLVAQPILGGLHHQYCRMSFSVRTAALPPPLQHERERERCRGRLLASQGLRLAIARSCELLLKTCPAPRRCDGSQLRASQDEENQ
jgi:Integrase core domain